MGEEKTAFEKTLREAVDEGLLILGESGREIIYFRLKHFYAINSCDISSNIEAFIECLRKIFGSGSKVIEKAIIRALYRKLGLTYVEKKNFDFFEYLNEARERLNH